MTRANLAEGLLVLIACAIGLPLSGCDTVTSATPIGSTAVPLAPATWNGYWRCGGAGESTLAFLATIVDAEKGELRVAYIDSSPQNDAGPGLLELRELSALLRSTERTKEGFYALSFKFREPSSYLWVLVQWNSAQSRRLFLWAPNFRTMSALVEQGRISGRSRSRSEVELALDEGQLEAMIPAGPRDSEQPPGLDYVPDAFLWTDPWFCERMD
jgi:hypothetical protein